MPVLYLSQKFIFCILRTIFMELPIICMQVSEIGRAQSGIREKDAGRL